MISRIDIEDMTDAQDEASVTVKPLEWHKSHMRPWRDDYHTVPTAYTVRCADENGWKWSGYGGHGYCSSPEAAQREAQSDWERRVLGAVIVRPSQAGDERMAERIAIALWREEAAAGTPSVQKRRNADTWADQAPELRDRWMRFARAALAAMDTPKGGGDEG